MDNGALKIITQRKIKYLKEYIQDLESLLKKEYNNNGYNLKRLTRDNDIIRERLIVNKERLKKIIINN